MRRVLVQDLLVLAVGMVVLILGISWHEQQVALRQQADARAAASLRQLDETLGADLKEVQVQGAVLRAWWASGLLDPTEPAQAARLVAPLLDAQAAVTSLNLARTDGRSLLFLKAGGVWSLRELQPSGAGARIRWMRLDEEGRILHTEAWTPMDYDPRTRLWYQLGASTREPVWTEAYP
ncbi:MAG: hypothetical protein KGI56_03585, partial [Acidobacteriota bacterium]|nr:hypothetical protein [Acidobacteriota bacterium]